MIAIVPIDVPTAVTIVDVIGVVMVPRIYENPK